MDDHRGNERERERERAKDWAGDSACVCARARECVGARLSHPRLPKYGWISIKQCIVGISEKGQGIWTARAIKARTSSSQMRGVTVMETTCTDSNDTGVGKERERKKNKKREHGQR